MHPRPLLRARRLGRAGHVAARLFVPGLAISACVATPRHAELAAATPVFSPQAFFAGRTMGEGVLRVDFSRARHVAVTGEGHVEDGGTLVLVQRVAEEGRATRTRTWRLREVGAGRFAVTLSDADGPVDAEVRGNRLHIRFTAKGGLGIEQWIYLQPGAKVALNRMVVRKFGIPVAALRETIRRVP